MTEGEDLKNAGMAQVAENNDMWMIKAIHLYNQWARDKVGVAVTGESIRKLISFHGIVPKHPNAWGALINHLVKQERLKPTKDWVKMSDPKSHARLTPLYEVMP